MVGSLYEKAGTLGDSRMEFVCGGPSARNLTICKVGAFAPGPEAADGSTLEKMRRKLLELGAGAFNSLATFSMVRVSEDYWIRYSTGDFPYHLKRISDCGGKPVERHWRQFTSNGTERPYVEKD